MESFVAIFKSFAHILRKFSKGRFFWIFIAVFSFGFVALFSLTGVYEQIEQKLYDMRCRIKPAIKQWNNLVFLDIDDASLVNAGEYPWPRSHYANGITLLAEKGVRSTVFDIQFMDPSPRLTNSELLSTLRAKAQSRQRISAEELDGVALDNDALFIRAIKSSSKTIIPYSFLKDVVHDAEDPAAKKRNDAMKLFVRKASIPLPKDKKDDFAACVERDRQSIAIPIQGIIDAAQHFGYVDSDLDDDGVARRVRLVRVFDGHIYFSMALTVIMDLCGVKKEDVSIVPGRHIVLKGAVNPATGEKGDITIPVDDACRIYINWAGDFLGSFRHVSFYSLLEYNSLKDDIHQYLDQAEIESGSTKRTELYGARADLYAQFDAVSDLSKKAVLRKKIEELNPQIEKIEDGYVMKLIERTYELREKEKKVRTEKSDELKQTENILSAIKLVRSVDGLKDSVCVVGLVAVGTQDFGVTPVSTTEYPMVGSYPNVINTILQKDFIQPVGIVVNIIIILICACLVSFVIFRQNAKMSIVLMIASIAAINAIVICAFVFGRIWVGQLGTNLAIIIPSVSIIGVKFLSEESQKRFIKQAFGYYLSKQVIDEIIKNPESLQLGGEERAITIFFSDVKGFTAISEKLSPQELVQLLNEYLSEMTDIILSHNGTVDKFIGDAIMAFYGAPHHFPNHAYEACIAAIEMQTLLKDLRKRWKKRGLDEIYARFGINTGEAVIGNMGSRNKMNYTAMGDSVNLASRLEGANKYYGTFSMISDSTYAQVKNDVEVRYLDKIRVVGKEQPIEIFELVCKKGGLTAAQKEILEIYNRGITLFCDREWEKARQVFRSALKIHKEDGPSATYVERCSEYIIKPPSKRWDGVYKLSAK
jgi:adenylate cyclase